MLLYERFSTFTVSLLSEHSLDRSVGWFSCCMLYKLSVRGGRRVPAKTAISAISAVPNLLVADTTPYTFQDSVNKLTIPFISYTFVRCK